MNENRIYINGYLPKDGECEDGDIVLLPSNADDLIFRRYERVNGEWVYNGTVEDKKTGE